jgi:hypothetical protein
VERWDGHKRADWPQKLPNKAERGDMKNAESVEAQNHLLKDGGGAILVSRRLCGRRDDPFF